MVGACIVKDGKILLVKENRPNHHSHGQWNQPAGWIDVGENPISAVKREVKEETGYTFTPTALFGVYSLVKKHRQKKSKDGLILPHAIKLIFVGNINGPQAKLAGDIQEVKWFTFTEVKKWENQSFAIVISRSLSLITLGVNFLA
ncbi:MAG: hypothetical protein COT81_02800 [Candidatus Buchananbacteria bacterium CG10_big_fil_rev_8_21_14_0_10_42_9]|uniref:Nudix hydrolase domain-containing protein n=1 Tax=Candidatus Buchananbacteria bacterium CG10_big_fil_rev_8_21_14_0_10_42_9 TaxID=1974526 RepID=A0A2H0W1A0_9BACT|nr:MAG: hypothetical protein COT81_02800 [Candidatus Buchananbacteria bacterium CG10_big_fil_rev_8_21_14_0_10_42_9]